MRKLALNVLMSMVVLGALAGVSVAMPGSPLSLVDDDDSETEVATFGEARSTEVAVYEACLEAYGIVDDEAEDVEVPEECAALKPGPATENPSHPVFGENGKHAADDEAEPEEGEEVAVLEEEIEEADDLEGDETEQDSFGAMRSAEVQAFGACMDQYGDGDAESDGEGDELGSLEEGEEEEAEGGGIPDECADLKPGPAHQNPYHPVFGENGKHADKGDDADEEGGDVESSTLQSDEVEDDGSKGKAKGKTNGNGGLPGRP